MDTKNQIAETFVNLVIQSDFRDVTIEAICKASYSSKKSFYRYFRDKADVASYVLQSSVFEPARELVRHLPPMAEGEQNRIVMQSVFRNIDRNRAFWRSLVLYGRGISVEELLAEGIRPFLSATNSLGAAETSWFRYSTQFFIGGYCRSLVLWIMDDSPNRPNSDEMAELYGDLFLRFWKEQLHVDYPLWTKNILSNKD